MAMVETRRDFFRHASCGVGAMAVLSSRHSLADSLGDYDKHDAIGLAELVRSGDVDPTALLETAIERLERVNPALNLVVTKMYDEARASIKNGLPDGPFTGVPFLLKDLGAAYAGVRYTMGSKLFSDFKPDHDDELTKRYKRAGLVTFGRTNTPEFGLNVTTESTYLKPALNPWDTERSTGGSSGGSAAAVAARIVPMAHGNDGAGSIRIPASCCGVFGLKPSRGRVPNGPDFGEVWEGFVTEHALTLSVRDSAALLDASSAPEIGAPYGIPAPQRPFLEEVSRDPGKLRVAYFTQAGDHEVDAECVTAVEEVAKLCEDLGHVVEPQSPDIEYDSLEEAYCLIVDAHTAAMLRQFEPLFGHSITADMVESWTWAMSEAGLKASATDFADTKFTINKATRSIGNLLTRYDVILSPTLGTPPPKLGFFDTMKLSHREMRRRQLDFLQFTWLHNVSGCPAMSVPLSKSSLGHPVGTQFVTSYANEAVLFRLAGQLEQARPWRHLKPRVLS